MRRILVVIVGLILAWSAGTLFLSIGGLMVPATRELAADLTLGSILTALASMAASDSPDRVWMAVAVAFWTLTAALLLLPPFIAAVVGEVAGARSFVWYAGLSGLLTAATAWIGHTRGVGPDPTETKLLALLFLTGAVSGLVYWMVAGRGAGRDPEAA
ncbi:hypothetical protein [Alsobacter sp. R-9]